MGFYISFSSHLVKYYRWPSRERSVNQEDQKKRMGGGVLKTLFGFIAFVVFIGFLHVEIVANGGTTTSAITTAGATGTTLTVGKFKHFERFGRPGRPIHQDLDLNYVSKRRVPNGPDPIHNRRAGKSRQPPGRA